VTRFPAISWLPRGEIFFTTDDGPDGRGLDHRHWRRTCDEDVSTVSDRADVAANGGDRLYFVQYDPVGGVELFESDGTTPGTVMVADLGPGPVGGYPEFLGMANGRLLFQALGPNGKQLWKSDGTSAGTAAITSSATASSRPSLFYKVGDRYFFGADDGIHGAELWKTDGTAAGTVFVKDINPGSSPANTVFLSFADVNGTAFFLAGLTESQSAVRAPVVSCGRATAPRPGQCV
jgi:ELWxxDGT repeat protein